jgi:Tfp pilus assembly protein PilF
MGRDWDVMSLSFLAPLILLFHLLDKQAISVKARNAILTVVLAASLTVPFLAVSIHTDSTERRFYTLLNNRSRNGWMIYANYFLLQKEMDKYKEIMGESYKRFPDYVLLQRGYRTLDAGDASKALPTAKQLIDTNPYNADFMQFLANVYEELNKNDSAEYYYQLALSIRPDLAPLLNELAQLYIKEGRYDEALRIERKAHTTDPRKTYISETLGLINIYLKRFDRADAIADSLFLADSTSPGGHLLKMTIALNKGLTEVARDHYEAYLKYGQGRSDYQSIKSYYSYLER